MSPTFQTVRTAGLWALLTLLLIALSVGRNPTAFEEPILYAEDGITFFKAAWELPATESLIAPAAGYLTVFDRVAAEIALLDGAARAPFFLVLFWQLSLLLPAVLLLSTRFSKIIPHFWLRVVFAMVLVALPNSMELYGNITSAQWYLALYAGLSLAAEPPRSKFGSLLDLFLIGLSFLTGPFAILFLPAIVFSIALTKYRKEPVERREWVVFVLCALCCAVQLRSILSGRPSEFSQNLGASAEQLVRLLAGQIVLGLTGGLRGFRSIAKEDYWNTLEYPAGTLALGLFILAIALYRGSRALRFFALCALTTLAASLISPAAAHPKGAWYILSLPGSASRYWLFPIVTLLWCGFELAQSSSIPRRITGVLFLLIVVIFGVRNDYFIKPQQASTQRAALEKIAVSKSGEEITVPGVPPQFVFTVRTP